MVTAGLAKRGRGAEPIGARNIECDRCRDCAHIEAHAAKDRGDEPKRGDAFSGPEPGPCPCILRELHGLKTEHQMGGDRAKAATEKLHHDIGNRFG